MKHCCAWFQAAGSLCCLSLGLALGVAAVSGCGGEDGEKAGDAYKTRESSQPGDGKTANGSDKTRGASVTRRTRRGVWKGPDGRKYWNNHPYDIWYGDAYAIASDTTPVGKSNGGKAVVGPPKKQSGKTTADKTANSQGDWKTIAPLGILEDEVIRIRNFGTQKLQTAGRYNSGYKELQYNGAALAVVAQIISNYPEDPDGEKISWKSDALYVRDLGVKMNATATALGSKKYRETKEVFEKFVDLLNRNKPAGLMEPDKKAAFADVASRGALMRRMDSAHKWMKTEVNSEEAFKQNAEGVLHEAVMLGTMAKVIGHPSYFLADDPDYAGYVNKTVEATQTIRTAVKTGDYTKFRSSLDVIYNQCNQCHTGFRD